MKPGATTRPPASMVLFAVPEIFPTSAIFPCAIPMLACFAGAPVPSTTMPFLIRMSRAMRHDTRKKRALSGPFRDCLLHWLARAARASGELPESWLGKVGTPLVVVARHEVAAFPHEEVEIRALVRLQHVIEIQAPVAAFARRFGLLPFPAPLRELVVRYKQLQPALRDVELDLVAVLD